MFSAWERELHFVHYIPVLTTFLAIVFMLVLARRYDERRSGPHLLWWAFGIYTYGIGTALEATISLTGNSVALTKAWYIAGAIFGGYPLATGSVYLHYSRRTAHLLTGASLVLVIFASIAVAISPVQLEALQAHRPSGAILAWQWVRLLTPFINGYAAIMLIGSALYSAVLFAYRSASGMRAAGNFFIAVGALLPGIGGGMAKAGMVEGLYIGEFLGLILIWVGYFMCVRQPYTAEKSSASRSNPEPQDSSHTRLAAGM